VGNTFDRGVEEGQAMAFLGLDPENLSPGVMTLSSMWGDVSLYHPLRNILVFSGPSTLPEVLARCL